MFSRYNVVIITAMISRLVDQNKANCKYIDGFVISVIFQAKTFDSIMVVNKRFGFWPVVWTKETILRRYFGLSEIAFFHNFWTFYRFKD